MNHSRSRELYDMTMLEVRRVMYDDLFARQPIPAGRLLGTRCGWLARYQPLLTPEESTKFVTLMKNLSSFVILLVDPSNHTRRQDRSAQVSGDLCCMVAIWRSGRKRSLPIAAAHSHREIANLLAAEHWPKNSHCRISFAALRDRTRADSI